MSPGIAWATEYSRSTSREALAHPLQPRVPMCAEPRRRHRLDIGLDVEHVLDPPWVSGSSEDGGAAEVEQEQGGGGAGRRDQFLILGSKAEPTISPTTMGRRRAGRRF